MDTFNEWLDLFEDYRTGIVGGGGVDGFGNLGNFRLNDECMFLIVIYILLFVYKKEVMQMVNRLLK